MDDYKLKIIELVNEMGQKRIEQYLGVYCGSSFREDSLESFTNTFCEYIEYCKDKSKDGYGRISLNGFREYLTNNELFEIMKNIEEYNERKDDYEDKTITDKCGSCGWKESEDEKAESILLHDEDFNHEYIYICPKCRKQFI